MRWSQGVWSERRVVQAVNATDKYFAMTYGPSGTAPNDDPRSVELYFERLDQAGLREMKRPDILIFRRTDQATVTAIVDALGGPEELPFTPEEDSDMHDILSRAILAVECENSLWKASQMPDYGSELRPMRRLDGQLGLPKNAVLPTVIVKQEDRAPLQKWQQARGIDIHIWHMFYDMAFGLALDSLEELISTERIQATHQTFQAPGGATTEKIIYKTYYHYAYPLGHALHEPQLIADHIVDKNGHVLPYVRFEGGRFAIEEEALAVIDDAASKQTNPEP